MAEKEEKTGQDSAEETAEVQEQVAQEPIKEAETGQDTAQETAQAEEQVPAEEPGPVEATAEEKTETEGPPAAEEPRAAEAAAEKKAEAEEPTPAKKEAAKPKAEKQPPAEPPTPPAKEKIKVSPAIEKIMDTIKNLSVLELAGLVKALEAEFGVSAAAPVAVVAPTGAAPTEAGPAAEEQTEFSVILTDIGANKINVIKAVREVTTLGLKESKDLVESAPKSVRDGVNKEEAATIKEKLEAAGAKAEIK